MVWKNTFKHKLKPNKLSKNPTISFRATLQPAILSYMKTLSTLRTKSKWISKAIEMKFLLERNKREYLNQILESDYELSKYILRQIGKKRSQ